MIFIKNKVRFVTKNINKEFEKKYYVEYMKIVKKRIKLIENDIELLPKTKWVSKLSYEDWISFDKGELKYEKSTEKQLPTEKEVLQAIFDNVFIRGIDLTFYERNFSNKESGLYDILVKLFNK